jgi:hypothetical protein
MLMPGNVVSGVAIKCPHCNDLHYELDQDGELDAADEEHEAD